LAARPPRQSFFDGPSTVSCVAVIACTVVIKPSATPQLSCKTLVSGARQFVVHEAFETIDISDLYESWLTPMTKVGTSLSLVGAEMTTRLAPAFRWPSQPARSVKRPVDSQMISAPTWSHFNAAGSFSPVTRIVRPSTTRWLPLWPTSPL